MAKPAYSATERDLLERKPIYRELAERRVGEMVARLLWLRKTNTVWVELHDAGVNTTFQVPNEEALEGYYHPYPYAQRLGKLASRELVPYEGEDGA